VKETVGSGVVIRPAQAADAAEVYKLVTSILQEEFPADQAAYPPDDLKKLVESYAPPNEFLVAVDHSQIVGTCGIKADDSKTAILRRLFVAPIHRCQGVGLLLLKEALSFCRSRGFQEIIIRTSTRMEKAIHLCQKLGFKEGGRWAMGSVTLIQFHLRLT